MLSAEFSCLSVSFLAEDGEQNSKRASAIPNGNLWLLFRKPRQLVFHQLDEKAEELEISLILKILELR